MTDQATLRILDANANRAREALRVAEDYARFALDSTRLTEELKALRHRLRACVEGLGVSADALLSARDTSGDVGTAVTAEPEMHREDAALPLKYCSNDTAPSLSTISPVVSVRSIQYVIFRVSPA